MTIQQIRISLKRKPRGFHLVTDEIVDQIPGLEKIRVGLVHLLLQHTSAALTLNENADPAVRRDFESHFQRLVPEDPSLYEHLDEGIDDAASHLKASLLGATLSLPVSEGRLALGTWQGIYLCEHRHRAAGRQLVATVLGE